MLSWRDKRKNLPSEELLIKPKTLSKTADGKLSIDVHRVNSKICHQSGLKKLIQLTTGSEVLMTPVAG